MSENNYDNLKSQIGDLGGEEEEKKSLGKLKHKQSYGQKEDLSEEEQKELEEFRRKVSQKKSTTTDISASQGWIMIDREEMGIRSDFYPPLWDFYIRPATVQAIKNWTTVDEERPDVLNNVFNDIIRTCVRIDSKSEQTVNWMNINSWDRFWFVLKVREYTYSVGQADVSFIDECSECGSDIEYKLTSNSLFYEFPDLDLIEKYWNGTTWNIDPHEYDVNHEPITLYTPNLGKDDAILEWATSKVRIGQKLDETFIKFLLWMLPRPIKDQNILDRQIQKIYKEFKGWDLDMFNFMNDVINNVTINPSEQLRVTCPYCSREATSNVQFPNGIKVLFETKSNAKKFGTR